MKVRRHVSVVINKFAIRHLIGLMVRNDVKVFRREEKLVNFVSHCSYCTSSLYCLCVQIRRRRRRELNYSFDFVSYVFGT